MKLGEKIKLLRTEQEITQPALAEKAGIEQSYLSKLENDKGSPSFDIINRIAMALGTTAMDLINSLSQSYIEDHLSHLPEVAAEYEHIRLRRETSLKKRLLLFGFFIAGGLFLFLGGFKNVFFPEGPAHFYVSDGIILESEPDYLFDTGSMVPEAVRESESGEEYDARMAFIKNRLEQDSFVTYEYLGDSKVLEVEGGRRKYFRYNVLQGIERRENDALLSLGLALLVAGMLGIAYSIHFHKR